MMTLNQEITGSSPSQIMTVFPHVCDTSTGKSIKKTQEWFKQAFLTMCLNKYLSGLDSERISTLKQQDNLQTCLWKHVK